MQDTHAIFADNATTKAKLATSRQGLIEAIIKGSLAEKYKNKKYSGDPVTGSVEISRFKNAESKNYGSARTAGAGEKLRDTGKVVINIDNRKEIVEEYNLTDIELYGVDGIVASRQAQDRKIIEADLDRTFFATASSSATAVSLTGITDIQDVLEAVIQSIETTKNDWVDGVEREDIVLTLNVATFGKVRNFLDNLQTVSTDNKLKEIGYFHGVSVESNTRQTDAIIAMRSESVAQPVLYKEYTAEKIPMSNDYAISFFYDYGTKAITPDLIKKVVTLPAPKTT